MKLSHFVIVKLTCFLIIGICIGFYTSITITSIFYLCGGLLFGLLLIFLRDRNRFTKSLGFGMLTCLLTVSIGILSVKVHDDRLQKNHYTHFNTEVENITFKISERLKSNKFFDKYVVQILKINNKNTVGKVLLNIRKDSNNKQFAVDDIFITTSALQPINPPLNPGQFNYKTYLEHQSIYRQISASAHQLLQTESAQVSIYGFADYINLYLQNLLKSYDFEKDPLAIINALLLGQRQDISQTLYKNYSKAGTVHILAVSGLHIGILLLILNFILKPVENLKYGKTFKTIFILILLWLFAVITGLSASVIRATTMFSLVAIALNWNRKTNIYNTIAISIFVLLLWHPLFLFDVGFQLSYLAVLGIVTFQPKFMRLWYPKNKVLLFFWNTLTVTIAAQIGVLPISLYYFHQFPGLFFLSNLIIVPLLGVILGIGILILILASIHHLPSFLVQIYDRIIAWMNTFISWIAKQEHFIFDDISIQFNTLIALYIALLCITYFGLKRHYKSIFFLLLSVILIQLTFLYNTMTLNDENIVIFHKSRNTVIGYRNKSSLNISSDLNAEAIFTENTIKNYMMHRDIKTVETSTLSSLYTLNNKTLFIIDSLAIYNIKTIAPDYVLLCNSPKVNLNRVIDCLKPKAIIANGSNYTSYITRWEATCKAKKLPFYQTGKTGAFILGYD